RTRSPRPGTLRGRGAPDPGGDRGGRGKTGAGGAEAPGKPPRGETARREPQAAVAEGEERKMGERGQLEGPREPPGLEVDPREDERLPLRGPGPLLRLVAFHPGFPRRPRGHVAARETDGAHLGVGEADPAPRLVEKLEEGVRGEG